MFTLQKMYEVTSFPKTPKLYYNRASLQIFGNSVDRAGMQMAGMQGGQEVPAGSLLNVEHIARKVCSVGGGEG